LRLSTLSNRVARAPMTSFGEDRRAMALVVRWPPPMLRPDGNVTRSG
jgi:hypothetical protein